MAALWHTFSSWEQAFIAALVLGLLITAFGWLLAVCADAFDLDALDEQRPEGE